MQLLINRYIACGKPLTYISCSRRESLIFYAFSCNQYTASILHVHVSFKLIVPPSVIQSGRLFIFLISPFVRGFATGRMSGSTTPPPYAQTPLEIIAQIR